jgi:hypothetical protein
MLNSLLKLPKEKRDNLILIFMATAGAVAGLNFLLINAQRDKLAGFPPKIAAAQRKLETMRKTIREESQTEAVLTLASNKLAAIEQGMASGDMNAWFYSTIKKFKQNYAVDIPQVGQGEVGEVPLLPKFPYKQVKIGIGGTALFCNLGNFIADFENDFPYFRLQNIVIEGGSSAASPETEKLSFRLEVVALIKPGSG